MQQIKPFLTKKTAIYIGLGLILIALFAFSGRYGYKYIKQEEKALKTHITDLEKYIVLLNDSLVFSL